MTATIPGPSLTVDTAPLEQVTFDMYRNIHKGLRNGLFAVTLQAGSADPGDPGALAAVATRWAGLVRLLLSHAEHEEAFVQPVLARHAPRLADEIASAHTRLESQISQLEVLADRAASAGTAESRLLAHRLYLGLAGFSGAYLEHQEFEEVEVNLALCAAVGADELRAIDHAIVASIPPAEMAEGMVLMLPAMNLEDRVELLGDIRAGAPAEAFAGVLGLAEATLAAEDYAAVTRRLGIA